MVSEGAAFVVAAQGSASLLAVGAFLKGRNEHVSNSRPAPLLQAFLYLICWTSAWPLWLEISVVVG